MLAAELLLADQNVQTAVPVSDIAAAHVCCKLVFFHIVDLEVAEWLAIERSNDRERVPRLQIGREEFLLVGDGTFLAPGVGDAIIVHPFMQELDVRQGGCWDWVGIVGDVQIAHRIWQRFCGDVIDVVVGRGKRDGPAVQNRLRAETCCAEREVLPKRRNVAGVKGFALPWELGSDGVTDVASPLVLGRWWRVEGREM